MSAITIMVQLLKIEAYTYTSHLSDCHLSAILEVSHYHVPVVQLLKIEAHVYARQQSDLSPLDISTE